MQRSLSLERARGRIEPGVNLKIYPIAHLIDVLLSEPFKKIAVHPDVFCDVDGVIFNSFKSYKNSLSLRALARITRLSNSMTIWSARLILPDLFNPLVQKIFSKEIIPFPFISRESMAKLSNLITRYAPDTKLTIKIGPGKLFNGDLTTLLKDRADSKRPIVMIGSSYFDRSAAKRLVGKRPDLSNRLWVFDTGRIII